jgi:hypothetical protein
LTEKELRHGLGCTGIAVVSFSGVLVLHAQIDSDILMLQRDMSHDRNLSRLLRMAICGSIWQDIGVSSSICTPVYAVGSNAENPWVKFLNSRASVTSVMGLGLDHHFGILHLYMIRKTGGPVA